MRRLEVQGGLFFGLERPLLVQRVPKTVQHAAFQAVANRHAQSGAQGNDFAAGMNAVNFAQGHKKDVMIAKPHHLGQS